MAAKKWYAWSNIKYVVTEGTGDAAGGVTKIARCGTEITQAKLGLNDGQWEELVASKAVRPMPYPVPPGPNAVSPVEHFKKLAKLIEEDADDISALTSVLPPLDDEPVNEVATAGAAAA